MDIKLALMCGTDIPIPELQLTIHQPTIKEISYIGETQFFLGAQCLNVSNKMLIEANPLLQNTTNFQIFMTIMQEKETIDKKEAVLATLQLIFPNHKILLTPRAMILSQQTGEENRQCILDETNFDIFQDYLRPIFCFNSGPMTSQVFNPSDKKAQEIANKLMRGRKRVAEQKGETNSSVFVQYLSTLTIGLESMSLYDLMNLTMYQIFDLIERFGLYTSWDLDIKTRLAGGKPDGQPENWMKNIH